METKRTNTFSGGPQKQSDKPRCSLCLVHSFAASAQKGQLFMEVQRDNVDADTADTTLIGSRNGPQALCNPPPPPPRPARTFVCRDLPQAASVERNLPGICKSETARKQPANQSGRQRKALGQTAFLDRAPAPEVFCRLPLTRQTLSYERRVLFLARFDSSHGPPNTHKPV